MGKCIIVAPLYQGEVMEFMHKQEGDLLICADGGYDAAVKHGLKPDLVIGDFDSMLYDHVKGCEAIRLPVHKDDTDMVVCLEEGRRRGYDYFCIGGCLGGRLDHTVANLQCLYDCAMRGETAWMFDSRNAVTILRPGHHCLPRMEERKFSVLSYTPEVKGLTMRGTEWELDNATLTNRYPLGVSNEILSAWAEISFDEGALLVLYSKELSFVTN